MDVQSPADRFSWTEDLFLGSKSVLHSFCDTVSSDCFVHQVIVPCPMFDRSWVVYSAYTSRRFDIGVHAVDNVGNHQFQSLVFDGTGYCRQEACLFHPTVT